MRMHLKYTNFLKLGLFWIRFGLSVGSIGNWATLYFRSNHYNRKWFEKYIYLNLAVLGLTYMDIDIRVLSYSVCFYNFLHNTYIDTASYLKTSLKPISHSVGHQGRYIIALGWIWRNMQITN